MRTRFFLPVIAITLLPLQALSQEQEPEKQEPIYRMGMRPDIFRDIDPDWNKPQIKPYSPFESPTSVRRHYPAWAATKRFVKDAINEEPDDAIDPTSGEIVPIIFSRKIEFVGDIANVLKNTGQIARITKDIIEIQSENRRLRDNLERQKIRFQKRREHKEYQEYLEWYNENQPTAQTFERAMLIEGIESTIPKYYEERIQLPGGSKSGFYPQEVPMFTTPEFQNLVLNYHSADYDKREWFNPNRFVNGLIEAVIAGGGEAFWNPGVSYKTERYWLELQKAGIAIPEITELSDDEKSLETHPYDILEKDMVPGYVMTYGSEEEANEILHVMQRHRENLRKHDRRYSTPYTRRAPYRPYQPDENSPRGGPLFDEGSRNQDGGGLVTFPGGVIGRKLPDGTLVPHTNQRPPGEDGSTEPYYHKEDTWSVETQNPYREDVMPGSIIIRDNRDQNDNGDHNDSGDQE